MQEFDNIKDMLYCEIDEISHHQKLDMNTVKVLGELMDILKDIGTVEMFEEGIAVPEDEYSFASSYSRNNVRNGYPRNNYEGNSYRNGRYSRPNRGYRQSYSREDAKDHMIQKLATLMNEANDEKDREAIGRLIEQMENN